MASLRFFSLRALTKGQTNSLTKPGFYEGFTFLIIRDREFLLGKIF
jgi:hypothetical protein